jgi:hypothetical protein
VNKELESKTIVHDEDVSSIKTDQEATKMNMQLMQRRLNDLPMRVSDVEDQIEQMKTQFASSMSNHQLQVPASIFHGNGVGTFDLHSNKAEDGNSPASSVNNGNKSFPSGDIVA